ncbi:MAG: sodium:proton antiporter [Kiritimatiellae bacterium]|nr:sodium:proton antiporter [Kiritimatiellia bacterium]
MDVIDTIAILITLAAILSYVNYRFIKFPPTIGLMIMALTLSLFLMFLGKMGWAIEEKARVIMEGIDFNKVLLQGMLSFLLFSGALHININDLAKSKWTIGILATVGVVGTTFMVGTLMYYGVRVVGLHLDFIYCLLFGSLIAPTDPISVLGILKKVDAPKSLATKITGESLFNDGVGVVIFLAVLGLIGGDHQFDIKEIGFLFLKEAVGGIVFGFVIGWIIYRLLRTADNYSIEILLTLALVMGGYTLAGILHVSGPIAMVIAGLLIGNQGRMFAMSEGNRERVDLFWEFMDHILNAILFLLIGFEVLVLAFPREYFLGGLMAIPLILFSRFLCVGIPITLLRLKKTVEPHAVKIITWAGLRGGISIALALSIPKGEIREIIIAITYIVVVFSIVVQGLTMKPLIRRLV